MRFKAVLFDLDGTLVDTIPDIIQATNAMRIQLGLVALGDATITAYVGRGTENLVQRALAHDAPSPPSRTLFYQGLTLFKQCYHEVNGQQSVLFDGVLDGLQAFARTGVGMAIVTNKQTAFTLPLLEQTGLADYFDAVVCGDTCAEKKPHPMPLLHACELLGVAPELTLMVGDSINDAQAARAAGMAVVILPYGYNEGLDVRDLEVDDIVPTIAAAAVWAASHS